MLPPIFTCSLLGARVRDDVCLALGIRMLLSENDNVCLDTCRSYNQCGVTLEGFGSICLDSWNATNFLELAYVVQFIELMQCLNLEVRCNIKCFMRKWICWSRK
jgi:hypothetical protein